jgi:chaperone modulatory protein CbpM
METGPLIPAETFCQFHQVEFSFILSLHRYGLVELVEREEKSFIPSERLGDVEKFLRLHRELDINPEGIDALEHLLVRMRAMEEELLALRNRLGFYETGS